MVEDEKDRARWREVTGSQGTPPWRRRGCQTLSQGHLILVPALAMSFLELMQLLLRWGMRKDGEIRTKSSRLLNCCAVFFVVVVVFLFFKKRHVDLFFQMSVYLKSGFWGETSGDRLVSKHLFYVVSCHILLSCTCLTFCLFHLMIFHGFCILSMH